MYPKFLKSTVLFISTIFVTHLLIGEALFSTSLLACICIAIALLPYGLPKECLTSVALGLTAGTALILCSLTDSPRVHVFGDYLVILVFFHWSEYTTMAFIDERTTDWSSFVINHSWAYGLAALASWTEFALEAFFLEDSSVSPSLSWLGIGMCLMGEAIRKMAMLTAARNFTHQVRYRRVADHRLVTTGLYALCRHPSYVGWFVWSVGTQVVLCNPVCAVAYTVAAWSFFNDRVYEEEVALREFFGAQYETYQERVPTGLPFIRGCVKQSS